MAKDIVDKLNICAVGNNETIDYSSRELIKYLELIVHGRVYVSLESREKYDQLEGNALWVGLCSAFESQTFPSAQLLPEVEDPALDDCIFIDVKNGRGVITGINNRSVLLAVYRFLTEVGCRWIRPGEKGEFIPEKDIRELSVHISEKAAYRYRGICIEGAVSYENVKDFIDWMPKIGFNTYHIEFREAYTFFDRWYKHKNNPIKQPEYFSVKKAGEFVKNAAGEIKKRGLLYHAVGHGWTCEPFGIRGLGWEPEKHDISPDISQYFAEINGKREIWEGVPLNTNLCYSNPEVRKIVITSIANYLQEHPEIDMLHFWLADGVNNQCECEECRDTLPSDYYVMMLNDLDELLTLSGIQSKIVFLIYVDLLWAPLTGRIKNPDRFIMMFAPITRTYSKEFSPNYIVDKLPVYKRNKLVFPSSVEENIGFLRSWQSIFKGDSYDFDYHFMWDHYNDPGYYKIADILSRDIKNLKKIGLNGMVNNQTQRAFFPTGFGMYVMGKTLWNDRLDFDEIADDYFYSAFGEDGESCRKYLSMLSELFDPEYLRNEKPQINPEAAERFRRIAPLINEFMPVIEKNCLLDNKCRAQSWLYLRYHAEMCILFASALEAWASGDGNTALERLEKLKQTVWENEDELQSVFDVWNYTNVLQNTFKDRPLIQL